MDGKLQAWFKRNIWNTEQRGVNLENPKQIISGWALDQILGGNVSRSGRSISIEGALTLSAVYRAVAIKAGIISASPFKVYRKTEQGRVEVSDHPVAELLSRKPNPKMNKTAYMEAAIKQYDLQGNHFAYIRRNGIGRVYQYDFLNHEDVEVVEGHNLLVYKIKGKEGLVSSDDMIHVPNMGNGIIGKSVIGYMREDASLMMDVREYGDSFFGRGGKPAGLLIPKHPGVTPAQRQETKESFQAAKLQGGEVAMPYGWEYKEISVPPADAEWVTTNDFSVANVARWFGVPTQKLGDSKVKYNNVESMAIEFLQDTMTPIAAKIENEYTIKSFQLNGERDLYAEINMDAYLRADSETRAKLYATYIQNGIKKPNEIRKLNNDPADPFGDDLMIQGATVPIRLQSELYKTKSSETARNIKKRVEKQVKEGIDPQLIIEGLFGNDGR